MSLKEEISNLLDSDDAYNSYETIDLDYCVNNILKLIEKRIDTIKFPSVNNLAEYGHNSALEKVKEMLK